MSQIRQEAGARYALKCVRKRDVVEKNVQDALVSELSILKEVPLGGVFLPWRKARIQEDPKSFSNNWRSCHGCGFCLMLFVEFGCFWFSVPSFRVSNE